MNELIYFDNAATSSPILPEVKAAMLACLEQANANPGRSGHRLAIRAAEIIYDTREALGLLFNVRATERIVLTKNSTEALNLVVHGLLGRGGHAVTTSFEHNSVARPLQQLKTAGRADFTIVDLPDLGSLTAADIKSAIRKDTKLIAVNGTSNVTGHHVPLGVICRAARDTGIPLLVDGSQTAGIVPLDLEALGIDYFAFTGHKHLFGPQGTGGLVIADPEQLPVFITGGTGSRSAEIDHPLIMPDKFEAGTLNTPGFAGLAAGVRHVLDTGIDSIITECSRLTEYALERLAAVPGLTLHTRPGGGPIVSFNLEGFTPDEVALHLDREHSILCRPGLHCAPLAHRSIGTFPAGSVRFGFSHFNDIGEIDTAADALAGLAGGTH